MPNIKKYLKKDSSFKKYLAILKTKGNRLQPNFFVVSVWNLIKRVKMYSDQAVKEESMYMDFSYFLSVLAYAQCLFISKRQTTDGWRL